MKLFKTQIKFIESKPYFLNILKGKSNTGKSESILHRVLKVIGNFAYEEDDNVLLVYKDSKEKNEAIKRYSKLKEKNKYAYMSLLSSNNEPCFRTFNELIESLSENRVKISNSDKLNIIEKILSENNFKSTKQINANNKYLILSEIKYMKNNKIQNSDEFMNLKGGPLRLRKNSLAKINMYKIYELYNEILSNNNLYDDEDLINISLENSNNKNIRYSHLFIENAQMYSKLELDFLIKLYNSKTYGSVNIVIDTDKPENMYSELIKKGRVYAKKVFGKDKKIYNFKSCINEEKQLSNYIYKNEDIRDKYKFIDLKHKRNFDFFIEHRGIEERLLGENQEEYLENELESVPVFNNIAAGEPILITPEQQDTFDLPKYWVRGSNKKFILKVKGDSMINANIYDGDLVVIEQTQAPVNGDIVAVNIEGSATLKTLSLTKTTITLLPENDNYDPIIVTPDEEFYILGKAIGLIRK